MRIVKANIVAWLNLPDDADVEEVGHSLNEGLESALAPFPRAEVVQAEEYAEELLASLRQCVGDAEEALSSGALLAHKLDREDVRRALLTARSKLRTELGQAAT